MRCFLLALLMVPFVLVAQESACTPFDNNGDNVVGIGDLIDLLARFGDSDWTWTAFGTLSTTAWGL